YLSSYTHSPLSRDRLRYSLSMGTKSQVLFRSVSHSLSCHYATQRGVLAKLSLNQIIYSCLFPLFISLILIVPRFVSNSRQILYRLFHTSTLHLTLASLYSLAPQ